MSTLDEKKVEIELQRLELERERLSVESQIERERLSFDQKFAHRHMGAIITAIVSLAAVIVSGTQVWVATIHKERDTQIAREQKERELQIAQLENEREWNLDVTEFVFKHRAEVLSSDPQEARAIRDIMLVTFPDEITDVLFERLVSTAPQDARATWELQTATSGWQLVTKVGRNCTEEVCESAGGCAKCVALTARMPPGARIQTARFFIRAEDGSANQVAQGKDLGWAKFEGLRIHNNPDSVVAEATLMNWRKSYSREGMLEVDWASGN